MQDFVLKTAGITLPNLREDVVVDPPAMPGAVLSLDIYGRPPTHPDNHLAYWNHTLPDRRAPITLHVDLNKIGAPSVTATQGEIALRCVDHWINPLFEVGELLVVSLILWREEERMQSEEFEVRLCAADRERLQEAIAGIERLSDNPVYVGHFADDEIPLPHLLVIESTSRCNLKCTMCPRSIHKSPSGDYADLDESVLPNLRGAIRAASSVCLSWMGEPLVNPNLTRIVTAIRRMNPGVVTTITSNGMLLTEKRSAELITAGLDGISVSIDAAEPALYRAIRVGGELETVKQNIECLNRLKQERGSACPSVAIAFVCSTQNAGQMPAIVELAAELGAGTVSFAPMDDFTLTSDYDGQLDCSNERKQEGRAQFLKAERVAAELGIGIVHEMPVQFFNFLDIPRKEYRTEKELFDNSMPVEELRGKMLFKDCPVPWQNAFVGHNGDVHPCCVSPRVLGNVKATPFEEIWRGEAYRAFRRALRTSDPPEECRRCRRAIWNRIKTVADLADSMNVGGHEIHGAGWRDAQTADGHTFREIAGSATLFLRHPGESRGWRRKSEIRNPKFEPSSNAQDSKAQMGQGNKTWLRTILGNGARELVVVDVFVNDHALGTAVIPRGWRRIVFRLPDMPSDSGKKVLKVTFKLRRGAMKLRIRNVSLVAADELTRRDTLACLAARTGIQTLSALLATPVNKAITLLRRLRRGR